MYMLSKACKIIMYTLLFVWSVSSYADYSCVFDEIFEDAKVSKLYRIDSKSSHVTFRVDSTIGHVEGVFESFYGGISLSKEGRGEGLTAFVIQADTLDTNGMFIKTILRGEDFFDVEEYRDITFVSRNFRWTDNNNAILIGDLTIRDITNTITFAITITDAGDDKITISATTMVDREAFGMNSLSTVVENDVELSMVVEATKYR